MNGHVLGSVTRGAGSEGHPREGYAAVCGVTRAGGDGALRRLRGAAAGPSRRSGGEKGVGEQGGFDGRGRLSQGERERYGVDAFRIPVTVGTGPFRFSQSFRTFAKFPGENLKLDSESPDPRQRERCGVDAFVVAKAGFTTAVGLRASAGGGIGGAPFGWRKGMKLFHRSIHEQDFRTGNRAIQRVEERTNRLVHSKKLFACLVFAIMLAVSVEECRRFLEALQIAQN